MKLIKIVQSLQKLPSRKNDRRSGFHRGVQGHLYKCTAMV
jgi:hypothetical protein